MCQAHSKHCCVFTALTYLIQQPYGGSCCYYTIPISQTQKLRPRQVKQHSQGGKWWSCGLDLGSLAPSAAVLNPKVLEYLPQSLKGNAMGSAGKGGAKPEVPSEARLQAWPGSGTGASRGSASPCSSQRLARSQTPSRSAHTTAPAAPCASGPPDGEPRLVTRGQVWRPDLRG